MIVYGRLVMIDGYTTSGFGHINGRLIMVETHGTSEFGHVNGRLMWLFAKPVLAVPLTTTVVLVTIVICISFENKPFVVTALAGSWR